MIRFFLIFAFVLGSAQAANATICTIPTTLVNGSIVDAAQLNGNFTSLQSCGNAVDSTNIGSGGIYASQIKPTSAALASFGGTFVYAFPAGLNVNGALLRANAGLTVVGTTNLAATTFSVAPTMSGANITAGTIPNSALASGGFLDTSATAQTKAGPLTINNTLFTQTLASSGPISGQSVLNSGAAGHVAIVYTQAGADLGSTTHSVFQTNIVAGATTVGVTLLGNSVFSGIGTYICTIHDRTTNNVSQFYQQTSGSAFLWTATVNDVYDFGCTGY